jgi:hypothetical protein
MSQPPDGEFRGRIPGTGSGDAQPPGPAGPTGSQPWGWDGLMQDRPARIPLLGLFLVLFGGILLVQQLVPGFSGIGAGLVVAIGIVLLISWGINRRPWELYGGTALIAIGLPPLLTDLRVIDGGPGWGTFFFGIALLVIAAMRAAAQGGVGWQAILGGILTVVGGAQVAQRQIADFPELDRLFWPVVILVIGVAIVYRSARARR